MSATMTKQQRRSATWALFVVLAILASVIAGGCKSRPGTPDAHRMGAQQSGLAHLQKDSPVDLSGGYRATPEDRRKIDNQILALQDLTLQALLTGVHASYYVVDGASAELAAGDVVCLAGSASSHRNVTKALPTPLANAAHPLGIAMAAATPGANVLVAMEGTLPPSVTGLAASSNHAVRVDTSARLEQIAAFSGADYSVGYSDAAGNLAFSQASIATGSNPTGPASGDWVGNFPSGTNVKVNGQRVPWKATAKVVATSNITLSGTQTIDGVALTVTTPATRVLAAGQSSASADGLYDVAAGAWSRSSDMAASADVLPGSRVHVSDGTVHKNSEWVLGTTGSITLGSTSLGFFRAAGGRVNVEQFGAVQGAGADAGVTNLAAINAAITAASTSSATGGTVYIPGHYAIAGVITGKSNVTLEGDGPVASVITELTAGSEYANWTDQNEFGVRNLGFTGATGANGLHLKTTSVDCNHPRFENVTITGFGGAGAAATVDIATGIFTSTTHGFATNDIVQLTSVVGLAAGNAFLNPPTFTASNDRVGIPSHGLAVNAPIAFNDRDNGQLSAIGLTSRAIYFVKSVVDANTITLSATSGGATTDITADSSGQSIVAWGVVPGDLDPQLEYYVVRLTDNTFKLSLTRDGSGITSYSRIPSTTLKVAKVYAGVFIESAGRNIYSARLQDVNVDGGILGDGGARQGFRQDTTSGVYTAVHTTIHRGEFANLNKRSFSVPGGEVYAASPHLYNVIDGSGGGTYMTFGAAYSFYLGQVRIEGDHIERILYAGPSTFSGWVDGTKIAGNWQISDNGAGNTILLGSNGAALDKYGIISHFLGGLYSPYVRESVASAGVEVQGTVIKTASITYPDNLRHYVSSAWAHVFQLPDNTGAIAIFGDGTSHGGLWQGNANDYNFFNKSASSEFLELTTGKSLFGEPIVGWQAAVTAPKLQQADNTTNSATAQTTTVTAQKATGSGSTGGSLNLHGNTGTSVNGTVVLTKANGTAVVVQVNDTGLGLYGATPVAQPSRVGQITDSAGGTPGSTCTAVDANCVSTLIAKINALELANHNLGVTQ